MIVIATHAVFFNDKDVYGPPHALSLYLNKQKIEHIFIKHRLEGNGYSKVEYYKNGKLSKTIERGYPQRKIFFIQYFLEIILTLKIVLREVRNCEVFIGVDPLNAFAGIILKILRKTRKTVFFCADFALNRFNNLLLNNIYLLLDTLSMNTSDVTWNVSKRIVEYRKKRGLNVRKNILIPNAPPFYEMKKFRKDSIDDNKLIIVSKLYAGVDFKQIFLALKRLLKFYPKLKLHVIGDGEEMGSVLQEIRDLELQKNIVMYGAKNHDFVHEQMASSYLGFALYKDTDEKDFRYFSDSMKMRDYLACGTPVIATGNTITGYEVQRRKAGIVVPLNEDAIYQEIRELKRTKKVYSLMRKNALLLAEENDIYTILNKNLRKLGVK